MKKPESIESAIEIISALNARTAANDVRIGELEQQLVYVTELRSDVVRLTASLELASSETAEAISASESLRRDNTNLKLALGNYMLATDAGQSAMREFKRIALTALIVAQQAELDRLG